MGWDGWVQAMPRTNALEQLSSSWPLARCGRVNQRRTTQCPRDYFDASASFAPRHACVCSTANSTRNLGPGVLPRRSAGADNLPCARNPVCAQRADELSEKDCVCRSPRVSQFELSPGSSVDIDCSAAAGSSPKRRASEAAMPAPRAAAVGSTSAKVLSGAGRLDAELRPAAWPVVVAQLHRSLLCGGFAC